MADEVAPMRIFIGTEPKQEVAAEVLKSSILRRTSIPVEFYESWTRDGGWDPVNKKYPRVRGTMFSQWRWIIPHRVPREGFAVYMDADQAVFADVAELTQYVPEGKAFAAVCGAQGNFGGRVTSGSAIETSVMVMNLPECDWDLAQLQKLVGKGDSRSLVHPSCTYKPKHAYNALMQACWMDRARIGPLPKEWNHFNIHEEGVTKLTHWTHVASQPYRNLAHPTANVFMKELKLSVQAGHVDAGVINRSIAQNFLHRHYVKALKG